MSAIFPIQVPGILAAGQEVTMAPVGEALTLDRLTVAVDTAPSGGDLVVRVQKTSGASPTQYLEVTIADGQKSGSATGPVLVELAQSDVWYVRIVTPSNAQWLSGWAEAGTVQVGSAPSTVWTRMDF